MTLCPQCQRHLLSQSSARCNWCGKIIEDGDYQAKAYAEREAYFMHQAQHDAMSLAIISATGSNSYDIGYGQGVPGTWPHMTAYQKQTTINSDQGQIRDIAENDKRGECQQEFLSSETLAQGRFQYLEW